MKKNYNNFLLIYIMLMLMLPNMVIADDRSKNQGSFNRLVTDELATKKLTTLLNNITIMNANFTQVITNKSGYILQEQAGVVQLAKPNLLHWQVLTPDHMLIVSDGEHIWNYDIDLEQVTVKKFSTEIDNTKIANLLFSNAEKTLENFYVTVISDNHFELNSKKSDIDASEEATENNNDNNLMEDIFVKAEILFNDSNQLITLRFYDELEQETTINFSKFKNQVNRNIFKFKIPEGVDLIEN